MCKVNSIQLEQKRTNCVCLHDYINSGTSSNAISNACSTDYSDTICISNVKILTPDPYNI